MTAIQCSFGRCLNVTNDPSGFCFVHNGKTNHDVRRPSTMGLLSVTPPTQTAVDRAHQYLTDPDLGLDRLMEEMEADDEGQARAAGEAWKSAVEEDLVNLIGEDRYLALPDDIEELVPALNNTDVDFGDGVALGRFIYSAEQARAEYIAAGEPQPLSIALAADLTVGDRVVVETSAEGRYTRHEGIAQLDEEGVLRVDGVNLSVDSDGYLNRWVTLISATRRQEK